MKPTRYVTVPPAGEKPWTVEYHEGVGRDIVDYALCDPGFSPSARDLVDALEANPKQFPKKNRPPLREARSAHLSFLGVKFCAVFTLDEVTHCVFVLSFDPHDKAYKKAAIRKRRG